MRHYTLTDEWFEMEDVQRCNEKIAKLSNMHTVPHVDMNAILEGREKRLTIEQSRQKGLALCIEYLYVLSS